MDRLARIRIARAELLSHEIFGAIRSVPALHAFMEHHVFAVWDFMALLKRLQESLTCTRSAWVPVGSGTTRRLINEIVLGEESDQFGTHAPTSHFEMYREAMLECGADTGPLDAFIAALAAGALVPDALSRSGAPAAARDFVGFTWELAQSATTHEVAAAFAFGREEIIPEMFSAILTDLGTFERRRTAGFRAYLARHVELDGSSHQELTARLLEELCQDDPTRWTQAEAAALRSLEARAHLWTGVLHQMQSRGVAVVPRAG